MAEVSRHIESQEKFHHLFVGINGAVLAAAIQTVKFENIGKYGITFEFLGWIFLAASLVIALYNTWKMQNLFYSSLETEKAGELLERASEHQTIIILADRFNTFVDKLNALGNAFNQRIRWQFIFFLIGVFSTGFARSIVGIMKFRSLH